MLKRRFIGCELDPHYTLNLLTFPEVPLAIGTWSDVIVVIIVKWIAIQYRIHIEEGALEAAFGSECEKYKKKIWKLFPGH